MTLSVATSGFLPNRSPACLATFGFICGGVIPPVVELPPEVPLPGSGGGRYGPGYGKTHDDALKETRHRRILQEDEEVAALIMAMITKGLM